MKSLQKSIQLESFRAEKPNSSPYDSTTMQPSKTTSSSASSSSNRSSSPVRSIDEFEPARPVRLPVRPASPVRAPWPPTQHASPSVRITNSLGNLEDAFNASTSLVLPSDSGKASASTPQQKTCSYVFKRGSRIGEVCGYPAIGPNFEFCKSHLPTPAIRARAEQFLSFDEQLENLEKYGEAIASEPISMSERAQQIKNLLTNNGIASEPNHGLLSALKQRKLTYAEVEKLIEESGERISEDYFLVERPTVVPIVPSVLGDLKARLSAFKPLVWNLDDMSVTGFDKIREKEERLRKLYATEPENPEITLLEEVYSVDSYVHYPHYRERSYYEHSLLRDDENILFHDASHSVWHYNETETDPCLDEPLLKSIPSHLWDNAVVAGGSVVSHITKKTQSGDFDFFLWGLSQESANHWLVKFVHHFANSEHKILGITRSIYSVGIFVQIAKRSRIVELQVISRIYSSPIEVITGFDLDSCCFFTNGTNIFGSPRGFHAIRHRMNVYDIGRQSTTYEKRLVKYTERGFRVMVPGLRSRYDWNADVAFNGSEGVALMLKLHRQARKAYKVKKPEIQVSDYGVSLSNICEAVSNRCTSIEKIEENFVESMKWTLQQAAYVNIHEFNVIFFQCGSSGISPMKALSNIFKGGAILSELCKDMRPLYVTLYCQKYLHQYGEAEAFPVGSYDYKLREIWKTVKEEGESVLDALRKIKPTADDVEFGKISWERFTVNGKSRLMIEQLCEFTGTSFECLRSPAEILFAINRNLFKPHAWMVQNPGTQAIGSFEPMSVDPFKELNRYRFV